MNFKAAVLKLNRSILSISIYARTVLLDSSEPTAVLGIYVYMDGGHCSIVLWTILEMIGVNDNGPKNGEIYIYIF